MTRPQPVSINDDTVTEGDSSDPSAIFAVRLSAASALTVTVDFATANGTATAGSDYQATSGTLTFVPGGPTVQTITVLVLDGTLDEPNEETFTVTLTSPTNTTLATAQATGTIIDDDPPPTISITGVVTGGTTAVEVIEGNSGTTPATFFVVLSAASGLPITVDFATADSDATAGSDYQATSGTLTFVPGGPRCRPSQCWSWATLRSNSTSFSRSPSPTPPTRP